jgi:HK97 family phage portal protein
MAAYPKLTELASTVPPDGAPLSIPDGAPVISTGRAAPTRPVYRDVFSARKQTARPVWLKSLVQDVTKQLAMTPATRGALSQLPLGRTGSGLFYGGAFGPWGWRPGDTFDYGSAVSYGRQNAIVVACLNAMSNSFPEAPPVLLRMARDGQEAPEPMHGAPALIRRPNLYMSWPLMANYLIVSLHLDGNAYFWKQRGGNGLPVALWPLPPWQISPVWPEEGSTAEYISGYQYTPPGEGESLFIPPTEVLHLRRQLDPENHRNGVSALLSVFRHIFTDEESSAFTAAMLKNFGVPGVILSPKPQAEQAGVRMGAADLERWKEVFTAKFSGDRRGEPMIMGMPIDVSVASFSPQQMSFEALHRIPETRICAVLNVPPSVANVLAGLEHNTYNNNKEQREAFMEQTMIPLWRLTAEELTRALLPDFERDLQNVRLEFDLSKVRALQENENEKMTRIRELTGGPILTLNEARSAAGYPAVDGGDAFYIPTTVVLTQIENLIPPEPDPALVDPNADPNADGGGAADAADAADAQDGTDGAASDAADIASIVEAMAWDGEPTFKAEMQRDPLAPEVFVKAAYSNEVATLRRELTSETEAVMAEFLKGQMRRTVTRALRNQKGIAPSYKGYADDALIGPEEIRALRKVLEPVYLKALQRTVGITSRTLRRTVQLEREAESGFVRDAGWRIRRINERTRRSVRRVLALSREKGWDAPRTGQELSKLAAFGPARAKTIARTEIGEMTNAAAQTVFVRSQTVTHVEFFDRESDELCRGWNGKILPVKAARSVPLLFHPNCSQQRFPIVRDGTD